MRVLTFSLLTLSLGLLVSPQAMADDFFMGKPASSEDSSVQCSEDCVGKWDSSIEFGYVAVSGNTETTSLNGRLAISYEIEKWRHAGFIASQTSTSEDQLTGVETDAEKYTAQLKSDYKYSVSAYAFGIGDYDNTKDSGFDYQLSVAFGAGYRLINSKAHTYDAELGLGSRKSKTELTAETNNEAIMRIAGLYKWQITKNSNFENRLSSEIGEDNTVSKIYLGVSANISDDLALKVSHSAKHQSDVPAGNEKLETVTSFTVVYNF